MRFRTELALSESNCKISNQSKILCLGSCFSQHIGSKLIERFFDCRVNPWGVSYNIVSIGQQIDFCLQQKDIVESELDYNPVTELFSHQNYHSEFSNPVAQYVVRTINERNKEVYNLLKDLDFLIITLGTSYAYQREHAIVSNCHKFPSSRFHKVLLEKDFQIKAFEKMWAQLETINPNLKLIITVSPVRHTKEGLVNNQLSKSILRTVAYQICFQSKIKEYFPSYEIMIDDLRDYRYYENDLIHPNSMAIEYIWDKFKNTHFTKETNHAIHKIEQWNTLNNHKIFHEDTGPAKKLASKKNDMKKELITLFPFLRDKLEKKI